MRYVDQLDLKGRRVFLRVDYNVPLDDGKVTDDTRIVRSLDTVKYILKNRGRLIIASHLGRPKGKVVPELSLKPVAERLAQLLPDVTVKFAGEVIGEKVRKEASDLEEGEILLLENLRFHPGEESNDPAFAAELAALAELYVNDAFGALHRAHASVVALPERFPPDRRAAGFLIRKEITYLRDAVKSPRRPFVLLLGGAKVSDKIPIISNLLNKIDSLLIGGAMAYTFMWVKNIKVGKSRIESDKAAVARDIMRKVREKGINFELPVDHYAAREFKPDAERIYVPTQAIPDDLMGLDIGPKSVELFSKYISEAGTLIWNGPMGVFEWDQFSEGTVGVAKAVAESSGITIVGGGDSVAAVHKAGVADKIRHITTGGGASLEFLAGKELPGLKVLEEGE